MNPDTLLYSPDDDPIYDLAYTFVEQEIGHRDFRVNWQILKTEGRAQRLAENWLWRMKENGVKPSELVKTVDFLSEQFEHFHYWKV